MNREDLFFAIEEEASYQRLIDVLRAVVELHEPIDDFRGGSKTNLRCRECTDGFEPYPCPTIQAIEKALE